MGRTHNSHLGVGTGTSTQGSFEQGNVDNKIDELNEKYAVFDSNNLSYKDSEKKYKDYLLNLKSVQGGPKAKFFKETLGYSNEDSEKFHNAVCEAINGKIPDSIDVTEFGIKYTFKTIIKGNNGKYYSANVKIVVQKDKGKTTWRIITIIPDDKDEED
jgi:hypothetical protein